MSDVLLLYDASQKKVGCVLLQAAFGGDSFVPQRIDNADWFFAPTPDMRLYRLTNDQVNQLVEFHSRRARATDSARANRQTKRARIVGLSRRRKAA